MKAIIDINDITIRDRTRRDFGDIPGLAESIQKIGLLLPVIINQDNRLIDGERRIRAHKHLGKSHIEVRVIDVPSLLQAEHDANAFSKQWTPSERVAIARDMESEQKERAKERMAEGGRSGHLTLPSEKGQSRDIIAKKAGFGSSMTMRRAAVVVERGIPEVKEAMDSQNISISQAYNIAIKPPHEQKMELSPSVAQPGRSDKKKQEKPVLDTSRLYVDGSPFSAKTAFHGIKKQISNMGKDDPNTLSVLQNIIDLCREKINRLTGDNK